MSVKTNLIFDKRGILTNNNQLPGTLNVTCNYGKVSINNITETASIGSAMGTNIPYVQTSNQNIMELGVHNLDQNSFYWFDTFVNGVLARRYYIDTADDRYIHSILVDVVQAGLTPQPIKIKDATISVRASNLALSVKRYYEFLDGVVPPTTAAQLYTFLKTGKTNVEFIAITNSNGQIIVHGLINGAWDLTVTATGYQSATDQITVTSSSPDTITRTFILTLQ